MTSDLKRKDDLLEMPKTKLEAINKLKERLKKEEIKHKRVLIQSLEEYLDELGVYKDSLSKDLKGFPELYAPDDSNLEDVLSVQKGVETPPSARLYAALITASYLQRKKNKKK